MSGEDFRMCCGLEAVEMIAEWWVELDRLKTEFRRSVVRLCAAPDHTTLRGGGSGLLFRLSGESFLVTAAHVLRDLDAQQLMCLNEERGSLISLGGQVLEVPDPQDVAVLHLDNTSLKRLGEANFRTQLDIDTTLLSPNDGYCVYGYPIDPGFSNASLTAWKANALLCWARLSNVSLPLENLDLHDNLVLEIDLNKVTCADGENARLPDSLGGISGGPVFRITPSGAVSIVGVETSTYRKSNLLWIKATPWRFVLGLIDSELGGIKAATRLLLPPR
jgi:hypothetical protein